MQLIHLRRSGSRMSGRGSSKDAKLHHGRPWVVRRWQLMSWPCTGPVQPIHLYAFSSHSQARLVAGPALRRPDPSTWTHVTPNRSPLPATWHVTAAVGRPARSDVSVDFLSCRGQPVVRIGATRAERRCKRREKDGSTHDVHPSEEHELLEDGRTPQRVQNGCWCGQGAEAAGAA